jgi:hypothetical protein
MDEVGSARAAGAEGDEDIISMSIASPGEGTENVSGYRDGQLRSSTSLFGKRTTWKIP